MIGKLQHVISCGHGLDDEIMAQFKSLVPIFVNNNYKESDEEKQKRITRIYNEYDEMNKNTLIKWFTIEKDGVLTGTVMCVNIGTSEPKTRVMHLIVLDQYAHDNLVATIANDVCEFYTYVHISNPNMEFYRNQGMYQCHDPVPDPDRLPENGWVKLRRNAIVNAR